MEKKKNFMKRKRMSRRDFLKVTTAVGVGAGITGFPFIASSQSTKTFNWKYAACVPISHPYGQILDKHFKNIENRSNGRLKIQFVIWGETPYKGSEVLRLMRGGLIESCELLFGYNTGDAPYLGGPELQFLLPNLMLDLNKFYAAYDKCWMNPKVKTVTDKILSDANAISLGLYYWGPQNFYTRVPVAKPADLKGLKIREYSAEGTDMLRAFGAAAVVLTAPEVYTALQRGLCDGVITAVQSMISLKWGEVMKYEYICNPKPAGDFFVVNKRAWNLLSSDLQKILSEEAQAACKEINAFVIDDTAKVIEILKKDHGWTITEATDADYQYMRKLCKEQVWTKWIERVGKDAKDILNACLEAVGASDRF